MKLKLLWILMVSISLASYGQENSAEINSASSNNSSLAEASKLFAQGKYEATVVELNKTEASLQKSKAADKNVRGLISYWKGICHNRSQNYADSISEFEKALALDYSPLDINYEYGQALYAAEKYPEARIQFRESLKKKFKRGVSLYYIGFISREMGEKKKAVTFFKSIDKLEASEAMEVKQAAELQIGDIYLEQVESHPDAFRSVEAYVIPQYQVALEVNKESPLAAQIKDKIRSLQQKYDLVLFKMRNGRPTLIPPYFARVAMELGNDSNVTFSPTEQQIAESKKRSGFVRTDAMAKYTFYVKNIFSISPELRFNYVRYLNRVPEIYRNDNYIIAPAIRTAYEHTLGNKPASTLFDFDYNNAKRDIDADKTLKHAFNSKTFMLGEKFSLFKFGESTLRLRRRIFDSYLDTADSHTTSLVFEQIIGMKTSMISIYSSYDVTRVNNDIFDTNAIMLRTDLIFTGVGHGLVPSVGLGLTRTDPINDPSRGNELLVNPNVRVSKLLMKNWRTNLKFDYQKNNSKDEENFAFEKYLYSAELEYVF